MIANVTIRFLYEINTKYCINKIIYRYEKKLRLKKILLKKLILKYLRNITIKK